MARDARERERERERESVCVCVCVRERERERERYCKRKPSKHDKEDTRRKLHSLELHQCVVVDKRFHEQFYACCPKLVEGKAFVVGRYYELENEF